LFFPAIARGIHPVVGPLDPQNHYEGSGTGLATVQRVIAKYGETVRVVRATVRGDVTISCAEKGQPS
jgi:hypothetical protein